MTELPLVYYLSKKNNLPMYRAGKELHTVEYDRGWVEYLLETSDLYFIKLTDSLLESFKNIANFWITTAWHEQNAKLLHLLKKLCNTRIETSFSLPLFADWRQGRIITCGNTRFTAEVLCGTPAGNIPMFFQTKKGHLPDELKTATPVYSTEQASELCGMSNVDYRLGFDRSPSPTVINSILRNTIYETDNEYQTFEEDGKFILNFWRKFMQQDKINLEITCNEDTVKFIEFDSNIWNVKFNFKEMHGFSFGEILGKFNQPSNGHLNLYVYDISENFNLSYLLPWTTTNSVWYHTLNKKINLFDNSRGAATACWPIVPMGNFTK